MRRIVSEDTVSANAVKGTGEGGHHGLPSTGIYVPNYKGVRKSLSAAEGSGQVSFMNSLAHMSQKMMAQQQALYDEVEVMKAVADVDKRYKEESKKFLQENPTGQYYTDYITNRYSEFSQEALEGASPSAHNKLKLVLESRKADVANHAFQKENEIYTGYAINETESQLNATLNEIMLDPSEVDSLSQKYNQQMEGMRYILPAGKFEKYQKEKSEELLYSYGLGLIRNKPFEAVDLVKGEIFVNGLSPSKFTSLQKQAESEVEHRKKKAKQYEYMVNDAKYNEMLATDFDLKVKIQSDEVSRGDIMAADIPERMKKERLRQYDTRQLELMQWQKEKDEIKNALDENRRVADNISEKSVEKYLTTYFKGETEKAEASGGKPMSCTAKVHFLSEHSLIFDKKYQPLLTEITTKITKSENVNEIMDACIAISGARNVPAIGKLDGELETFADLAISSFKGTKDELDEKAILLLRNEYFNSDKKREEENEKLWKKKHPEKDMDDMVKKFYKDNGFAKGLFGVTWPWADLKSPDKQAVALDVEDTMKEVFVKTGSEVYAKAVAKQRLDNILEFDEKEKVWRINPPRKANTGLERDQLSKKIREAQAAAAKILNSRRKAEKSKDFVKASDIKFESIGTYGSRYVLYTLKDKDDDTTRDYVINNKGEKLIYDFRK